MEVVASLSQGRTAAAQCGLFTYKSAPVIFEPPSTLFSIGQRIYLQFSCYICLTTISLLMRLILIIYDVKEIKTDNIRQLAYWWMSERQM